MTAAMGLFHTLSLPTPEHPASDDHPPLVVYGASSSVGNLAVQLARLANIKVIGIAGAGLDYAKAAGASPVIDYRGLSREELIAKIRAAAGSHPINYCFDCIAEGDTFKTCIDLVAQDGGKVALVLGAPEDLPVPSNVTATWTYVPDAHTTMKEFAHKYFRLFSKWIKDGKLGNDYLLLPNGLESVPDGLNMLRAKKVSGKKLVYRIRDTPALK